MFDFEVENELPQIKVITVGQVADENKHSQLVNENVGLIPLDKAENCEKVFFEKRADLEKTNLIFVVSETENSIVVETVKRFAKEAFVVGVSTEFSDEKFIQQVDTVVQSDNLAEIVADFITVLAKPNMLTLCFDDFKSSLSKLKMISSVGFAKGENALMQAMKNALSGKALSQCKNIVIGIIANENLEIEPIFEMLEIISEQLDENIDIVFGTGINSELGDDETKVVVLFD